MPNAVPPWPSFAQRRKRLVFWFTLKNLLLSLQTLSNFRGPKPTLNVALLVFPIESVKALGRSFVNWLLVINRLYVPQVPYLERLEVYGFIFRV